MRTHGRGYTLIEVLITITILALLFATAPSLAKILGENRQYSQLTEMQRLLEMTRNTAISRGRITTLCGSADGIHCSKNWLSASVLIFDDRDNNRQLDEHDQAIYRGQMPRGQWHWHGSNKAYLRFRPDGSSMEWGHFTLCPMGKEIPYASQLILNFVGRPYTKQLPTQKLEAKDLCS